MKYLLIFLFLIGFVTSSVYASHISSEHIDALNANPTVYKIEETSSVNDFRGTQNPNQCWYQDDDGNMLPCKMGSDSFDMAVAMFLVVFWPYVILGIGVLIIFIVWKKMK